MNNTRDFHSKILSTVAAVKEEISKIEDVPEFLLKIVASGRIDGDVKIEFTLSESSYAPDVTGGDLAAVVTEFLRRHGWNQRHAPLCLPNVDPVDESFVAPAKQDEEIPF